MALSGFPTPSPRPCQSSQPPTPSLTCPCFPSPLSPTSLATTRLANTCCLNQLPTPEGAEPKADAFVYASRDYANTGSSPG